MQQSLGWLFMALGCPIMLSAQVCTGQPALGGYSQSNVGGGVSFADAVTRYSAGFTAGSEAFFSGSFTYSDVDGLDASGKILGAGVGYQIRSRGSPLVVCPTFGVSYGFGLELLGIDITAWTFSPSLSLGYQAVVSPTVDIVPFGLLGFRYIRLHSDDAPPGQETHSEEDGALAFGLTLLLNKVLGVTPSVAIPLGSEDGSTGFGVGVSIALGGARPGPVQGPGMTRPPVREISPEPDVVRENSTPVGALDDTVHQWFVALARENFGTAYEMTTQGQSRESLRRWWLAVQGESRRLAEVQTLSIRRYTDFFLVDVLCTFDAEPSSQIEVVMDQEGRVVSWRASM